MLTVNTAHDIEILEYWICIYSVVEGVFKKCFLESKILPTINRYPIYKEKEFGKNKNKAQFSFVKSQLMVYQNEYHIFKNFSIKISEMVREPYNKIRT